MSKNLILITLAFLMISTPSAFAVTQIPTDTAPKQERVKLKAQILELKEDYAERVQAKKESLLPQIKKARSDFKEKLASLKNTRKINIAERVDSKLLTINQNSTNRMSLSIEKLETLLDKFASRTAVLKTEGKNTTEVESAITTAETSIETTKDAVAQQASKEYIAEITDETTLKSNMGTAVKNLRVDLKTTHDIVKDAKQSVMDVARALAKINSKNSVITPGTSVEPTVVITPIL